MKTVWEVAAARARSDPEATAIRGERDLSYGELIRRGDEGQASEPGNLRCCRLGKVRRGVDTCPHCCATERQAVNAVKNSFNSL